MSEIPIIAHQQADPTPEQCEAVALLAEQLLVQRPELGVNANYRRLIPEVIEDVPTLHIDDLGEIARLDQGRDVSFMQQRGRLRAGRGDLVVCTAAEVAGYEEYCRENLGLGSADWLRPQALPSDARQLALACWKDRPIRRTLIQAVRSRRLRAIHPHMGTRAVWELADLLRRFSRQPFHVIAPPPAVTRWVNHKLAFADVVSRLLGPHRRPQTVTAGCLTKLACQVSSLAQESRVIGIKIPDSAGGGGNLVLDAGPLERLPLLYLSRLLEQLIRPLAWDWHDALLVGAWETAVLYAPSAQLWIPPPAQGQPIVEGIFEQIIVGREGTFVGSCPAELPEPIRQVITTESWILASLFQRLGYIGRCSFDLILVGDSLETSRIEFLECNGRWGGTSGPMTLMNRVFGDWSKTPYASSECRVEGLRRLSFLDLLESFAEDLYDRRTRRGWILFYCPGQIASRSAIQYITLGSTRHEALNRARLEVPARLRLLVEGRR